jgi:hypothetical protein
MYIPHVLIVEFDKFNELYGISSYKEIKNKIFELLKHNRKRITLKHKKGNVANEITYSFYVDFKNVSNGYVRNVAQSFAKLSYYDVDIESQVPAFFHITVAATSDIKVMPEIPYEKGRITSSTVGTTTSPISTR